MAAFELHLRLRWKHVSHSESLLAPKVVGYREDGSFVVLEHNDERHSLSAQEFHEHLEYEPQLRAVEALFDTQYLKKGQLYPAKHRDGEWIVISFGDRFNVERQHHSYLRHSDKKPPRHKLPNTIDPIFKWGGYFGEELE